MSTHPEGFTFSQSSLQDYKDCQRSAGLKRSAPLIRERGANIFTQWTGDPDAFGSAIMLEGILKKLGAEHVRILTGALGHPQNVQMAEVCGIEFYHPNDGRIEKGQLAFGDLKLFALAREQQATVTMQPAKQIDLGNGPGQSFTKTVKGGVVGLMLDGRGRPLPLPGEQATRVAMLTRWYQAVGLYPAGS